MKQQLLGRIARYRIFLQRKLNIPDLNGEHLTDLNFDFDHCANEYINQQEQAEAKDESYQILQTRTPDQEMLIQNMRLNDQDLEGLFADLERSKIYEGQIQLGGNNITDQTLNRIASLLRAGLKIDRISLRGCQRLTYLGLKELAQALKQNRTVKYLDLTDCTLPNLAANTMIEVISQNPLIQEIHLGKITDKSLLYLSSHLQSEFHVQHLGFQEDLSDPWQDATKDLFLDRLRANIHSSKLISFTLPVENLEKHQILIGQLELMSSYNRQTYLQEQSNNFKAKDLDTEHPEYYDPDNFEQNAFKFSVKSYLSNVFESLLDESLYFLEKERQNVLRDEEIQKVTNEFTNKGISEDICTSDGSLFVLAKYLIGKTRK